MHEHGPNCMEGPIRGSTAWWRGLAPQPQPGEEPAVTTRKNQPQKDPSGIRQELVERIRGEIAAGTYDTPARWEAALDRLLDRLDSD